MVIYVTQEGDTLDWVVWRHYGTISVLERVIQANPKVTDEKLSAGIEIKLPYIEVTQKNNLEVRLWS